MRLTKPQPDKIAMPASDDGFAELREGFRIRLGSERLHLVALSASLASAMGTSAQSLNDLRNRAHRLSGTAAIFELLEIAKAARTLELAVDSISNSVAHDRAASRGAALDALVRLIAILGKQGLGTRSSTAHRPLRRAKRTLHG
jgi:chemotaxis protein histidine kinase CheA